MALIWDIPQINITPEAEEDDDHIPSNISEALTDVEDLFDDDQGSICTPVKKKNKLKIKLSGDGGTTDLEDFEASSGDDDEEYLVRHTIPVTINDLDLEAPLTEENFQRQTMSTKGNQKIKMEFAMKQQSFYHSEKICDDEVVTTENESYESNTDTYDSIPENEYDLVAYKAESHQVADNMTLPPSVPTTPSSDYSDRNIGMASSNIPASRSVNNLGIGYIPQDGGTDIEVLGLDSGSENEIKKKLRKRRHRNQRKQSVSDPEDVYLSDSEILPKPVRRQRKKHREPLVKSNTIPYESENEENEKLPFPVCKQVAKKNVVSLEIPEFNTNFQTDIEDFEEDTDIADNDLADLLIDEAALDKKLSEMSSDCVEIKEESISIQNYQSCEPVLINVEHYSNKENTDEDEFHSEAVDDSEQTFTHFNNYMIKFSPSASNFESIASKCNLNLPLNTGEQLTDCENIDSSPEVSNCDKLPLALIQKGSTEDEQYSDDDYIDEYFTPEISLPPATRNLILVQENDSLVPTVRILPLDSLDISDVDSPTLAETDEEAISEAEDAYQALYVEQPVRGPTPDLPVLDGGLISEHENVNRLVNTSSPLLVDSLTDSEDLILDDRIRKRRAPKFKFMYERSMAHKNKLSVANANNALLTDTEEISLSDDQNFNTNHLRIYQSKNIILTDTENIDLSEEEKESSLFTPKHMKNTEEKLGPMSVLGSLKSTKCDSNNPNNFVTPATTDSEDVMASAEEDSDQISTSQIQNDSKKTINLDAPEEVMYLKGGGYSDPHSDNEYLLDNDLISMHWGNENGELQARGIAFTLGNYSVAFECKVWDTSRESAGTLKQASIEKDAAEQGEGQSKSSSLHQVPSSEKAETEDQEKPDKGKGDEEKPKKVTDQHQLSEEMKKLLKEMEKESKQ